MVNKNVAIGEYFKFPKYDILYCDPPWEERMLKFFYTKAKRQLDTSIYNIITQLGLLANNEKPFYVEYSIKGSDDIIHILKNCGHRHISTTTHLQTNKKPYVLLQFNTNFVCEPNKKGGELVQYIVKQHNKPLVFDPFAGIGFTAKNVYKAGGRYIGYELNKERFDRLQEVCKKHDPQMHNENI